MKTFKILKYYVKTQNTHILIKLKHFIQIKCFKMLSNNTNDIILDNKTIFYKINNFKIKKHLNQIY